MSRGTTRGIIERFAFTGDSAPTLYKALAHLMLVPAPSRLWSRLSSQLHLESIAGLTIRQEVRPLLNGFASRFPVHLPHMKFAASSVLPFPLYLATSGYWHSGLDSVIDPDWSRRAAVNVSGALPSSTQERSASN